MKIYCLYKKLLLFDDENIHNESAPLGIFTDEDKAKLNGIVYFQKFLEKRKQLKKAVDKIRLELCIQEYNLDDDDIYDDDIFTRYTETKSETNEESKTDTEESETDTEEESETDGEEESETDTEEESETDTEEESETDTEDNTTTTNRNLLNYKQQNNLLKKLKKKIDIVFSEYETAVSWLRF
jgi:cobalamin biosynthesis protein CobT